MKVSEMEALMRSAASLPAEARTAIYNTVKSSTITDDKTGDVVDVTFMGTGAGDGFDQDLIQRTVTATVDQHLKQMRQQYPLRRKTLELDHADLARFGGNSFTIPANVKRWGRLNHFKGERAEERAYRFGMWCLATMGRSAKASAWCAERGLFTDKTLDENGNVVLKSVGALEGVNERGGFLVPEELDNDVIDLRNEYGVFRRNANVRPMMSDVSKRPRRVSGLTAHFVGEAATGTASDKRWDSVQLTAKKLMVMTKYSSEVGEDAVINLGDDLAGEIAYAFSLKEDECGFNGTGTSTYGGIQGITDRLTTINGVDDGGGLVLASGNAYGEITLADLRKVISICPAYARRGAKWFVSALFHDAVMMRLLDAAGGNTIVTLQAGGGHSFLGYPVELSEVLPIAEDNSQVCALFGDLKKSSDFGDRRQTTVEFSKAGTVDGVDVWTTDEIAVRGTERIDIVNHSLGTSSAAGPVVGLITTAS